MPSKKEILSDLEDTAYELLKEREQSKKYEQMHEILRTKSPKVKKYVGGGGHRKKGTEITIEEDIKLNEYEYEQAGGDRKYSDSDYPEIHDLSVLSQLGAVLKDLDKDSITVYVTCHKKQNFPNMSTYDKTWGITFKYPSLEVIE